MTKLEALISLNMVGEIGSIRLNKLLEFFGTPENILKAPQNKLMAVSGIGKEIANKIRTLKEVSEKLPKAISEIATLFSIFSAISQKSLTNYTKYGIL